MGLLKTAAFVSLPVLGICATIIYLLHKKEEEDLQDTLQDVKTSRVKTIEMKIPNATVGVVIGRGGSNIKEIQEKTGTRINFKDNDNEEYRTCYIRGTAEDAQLAESMLHEIIFTQPLIENFETWVPQRATGRIIGRGGENIRAIARASNAKINVDNLSAGQTKGGSAETRILIKGTSEQIAVALSMIQEKVEEDAETRRKMDLCQASRSPRHKPKPNSLATVAVAGKQSKMSEISERLMATGSDGFFQVFVSAVVSPSCFWIQVCSPRAVELDHLLDEMTDYYSIEENRTLHTINELELKQIVAAPFSQDDKWYRAEVKSIEVNEQNKNDSQIDLYYVDYGDSEYRKKNDVYQLRTDFLRLPFQAIECSLANVKPSDADNWSEKAIDLFEELSHVAQWKPLMAKLISCDQQHRGPREGSPVPSISLFDTSGAEDINISEELVKQGFAELENKPLNGNLSPGRSNTTSPSLDAECRILDA